jgi:hypothetical protein
MLGSPDRYRTHSSAMWSWPSTHGAARLHHFPRWGGSGVAARGARAAYRQTGPRRKASMKRRAWCSQQSAAACMAATPGCGAGQMKAHADERAMCGGIPRACILASCLNNQAVLVLRAQPGARSFARRRRARRAASADQARAGRRSFETISNFGFVLSAPD